MLSEQEAHALRQIELSMRADAPRLAGSLTRMEPDQRWSRHRHDAAALLSALSGVLCLVIGAVGSGMIALMLCAAVVTVRRWRFPAQPLGLVRRGPALR